MTTDFVREHAHKDDIDTSKASAYASESMASRHKVLVWAALKKHGPLSSEQLTGYTGLNHLQVMKRISDLRNDGAVIDSGERERTMSGRLAAVWKLYAPTTTGDNERKDA